MKTKSFCTDYFHFQNILRILNKKTNDMTPPKKRRRRSLGYKQYMISPSHNVPPPTVQYVHEFDLMYYVLILMTMFQFLSNAISLCIFTVFSVAFKISLNRNNIYIYFL